MKQKKVQARKQATRRYQGKKHEENMQFSVRKKETRFSQPDMLYIIVRKLRVQCFVCFVSTRSPKLM